MADCGKWREAHPTNESINGAKDDSRETRWKAFRLSKDLSLSPSWLFFG